MNVELLQYPEHPERAVATAARLRRTPPSAQLSYGNHAAGARAKRAFHHYEIGRFFSRWNT